MHFSEDLSPSFRALQLSAPSNPQLKQRLRPRPLLAYTYNNFGNLMRVLGDFDMAIDLYQKAIDIQPDYADCHYSLGTIHLLLGDLHQGWIGHEWRNHHRGFRQPLW